MIFGWNPVISIPGGCFVAALLLRWRYSRRAMTP
jgi:hypothetical protein